MDETSANPEDQVMVVAAHGADTSQISNETSSEEGAAVPPVVMETEETEEAEHAELENAVPSPEKAISPLIEQSGFLKLSPVADMKRAISTPTIEQVKYALPPPVSEFKRAVSTPSRTPVDEAAALAAIKAIDALPKLPSRQRTDTQCSSCKSSLLKEVSTRGCSDCKGSSRALPPLKETSPLRPVPILKAGVEGKAGVCCLPPFSVGSNAKTTLSQLPPLEVRKLPPLEVKELPPPVVACSPTSSLTLNRGDPVNQLAQTAVACPIPAAGLSPLPPKKVRSLPQLDAESKSVTGFPELAAVQPLSPATDKTPPCQLVPWLQGKGGTASSTMKDTSAASACGSGGGPIARTDKWEEASGVWNPPDDRSEAPIPPRRQMSGDHDFLQPDPLPEDRFEPSTPATTTSRRGRRTRGLDKWHQRSVPDLQRALASDLDASEDPKKDGTPKSPYRRLSSTDQYLPRSFRGFTKDQTSTDIVGLSTSMHTGVEIRKNGFVRRGRGSRGNFSSSLSPGRQTLGSSSHSPGPSRHTLGAGHGKRSMRKVTSWDRHTTFTTNDTGLSSSLHNRGDNNPCTHRAPIDSMSKNNGSLRASRHNAIQRSPRRLQHCEQMGDPPRISRHSREEVGISAWSPTSSISLESASFECDELSKEQDDMEGSELHDEYDDDVSSCKRPPVLYVQFKKEDKGMVHAESGHSGNKMGMKPGYVEGGSGTRTTSMEAEASLTWAYDLNTGTYKMVPMAPTGGMPWLCLCGQENEADFNFCGMCAQPKAWACPHCQFSKNKSRFPFCGGCGARRMGAMDPRPVRPTFLAPADPTSIY